MKNKLFLLPFISLYSFLNCLPSKDIWNQVVKRKSKYSIINNTNYFFYQEKDYCKRDIYSEDMIRLYEKQKSLFLKRNIPNYIFVVENFDEKLESIENGAYDLGQYIYNEFKANIHDSIIALFSIKTRRIRIATRNYRLRDKLKFIVYYLRDPLRKQNYYEAFLKYYDLLEYYLSFGIIDYFLITLFIIGIFILILEKIKKCYYLQDDPTLKRIINFLKSQKANKNIFAEYCIICLCKLKEGQDNIELIDIKENNKTEKETEGNTKLIETESDGISTLNCGHRFHTECIKKWPSMKKNCPICKQIKLNEEDKNKIVWKVQTRVHPQFSNIRYNIIYTRDFYKTPEKKESSRHSSIKFHLNRSGYTGNW